MADIYFYKSITGQVYNFRDDRVDSMSGALPATEAPLMDGTAAVGTSIKYAREDHVHPSDTSKVDKEAGKGLSTNDFTTAEKNKLAGIAAGAEVNVQSDWNVTNTSSDAYIKNKPTIPTETSQLTNDSNFVSDANYVHTDNNFTTALKNKLNGIASGAEVNVQSDWDQTDTAADDYIKNKPSLLALGETSTTAYRGDRGKTAYTHATDSSRLTTATASGLYKVASTAQGHIASLTAVTKADITALGIPAQDTTYSNATQSAAGLMSSADKTKLDGIATGAEVNQNAFSNVKVGSTTIAADAKTDTLTLAAGSNITLTPDATNDKVTIAATDTTYSEATSSAYGLVKIGYSTSGKNYAVQLSSGKMYVNVPWTDNNTTYSAGTGLTLSSTTFSVSQANASTIINLLGEGTSNATRDDYIVAQYAGGGTSNTNYYRRKLSNIFAAMNSSDITTALGYTPVQGVKGNQESSYRTGNVNLTALNIGSFYWTDVGTALADGANVDTGLTTGNTYYSSDSTKSGTLTGTPPTTGSGFKIFQGCTYGTGRQYQIALGNNVIPWVRYRSTATGTWGAWRNFATVTSGTAVGGTTTPIYAGSDGTLAACSYTISKSVPSDAVFTDTKNTAGSTDSSSKLFLIGATSQAANPQTYSHDTAYVGTDGCLYSNSTKVKVTQTAKTDPTASGTGITYIATITQNANGEITATKSTVRSASASQSGVMSSAHYSKLEGIEAGAQVNTVTGVKGNSESSYRTGNVNLTAANIGAKATQTAVSDPTASGTSATFIATISQDIQGVITATKKTVRSATASQSGLMSAADKEKLDRMNGMVNYRNYDNGAQSTITMTSEVCMVFFMRDAGRYGLYLCSYWTNTIVKIAGTQTSVTTEGNAKISKNANSSYIYLDNTTGSSLAVMIIGGYISDYEIP